MNANHRRNRPLASLLSLALMAGAGLATATAASAYNVSACGALIDASTGNATLQANLTYNGSAACLQVKDGVNLDLHGHTITCQTGSTCGQAVLCPTVGSNASSLVNSGVGSDTITDISGRFTVAVKNCGSVKNLKIVDATTAIFFDDGTSSNGQDFTGNVIESHTGGTGIDVKIEDSGDTISDNRITGGDIGIHLIKGRSVANGAYVRDNIIRKAAVAGISCSLTSNDYFRIETNAITDGGSGSVPFSLSGTHATYTSNICEDEGAVDNGRCACEMDRFDLNTVGTCPL